MKELILTGFREFWPKDENNAIFLGPWCFVNNHKYKFWDQENFTIASSPWKTSQDILRASLYIDLLVDRIIPPFSKLMNNFHGAKYSERFWKIYTIYWLLNCLSQLYDRYTRLKFLEQNINERLTVKILKYREFQVKNWREHIDKIVEEHYYNLILMSDIIRTGKFDFLIIDEFNISCDGSNKKNSEISKGEYLYKDVKKLIGFIKSKRAYLKNYIYSSYLSSNLYLGYINGLSMFDKLCLYFAYDPFFIFRRKNKDKLTAIVGNRKDFVKQHFEFGAKNEFEKIVEAMILHYIPDTLLTTYLKDGDDKISKKIWIGGDIYLSERHAYKIADVCEYGGKWLSVQHGGGYGQLLSLPAGKIEYETADGFITWGWNYRHIYHSHYYPLTSPMLSKLPKHKQRKEHLIFISGGWAPYYRWFIMGYIPDYLMEYMKNKNYFFLKLEKRILLKVKYRPNFFDYGTCELEYIKKVLPLNQVIKEKRMVKKIQYSKLIVITYLSTAIAEAFVMNTPTILFWNPRQFAVTSEAAPYFDKLRSVGILFDTPEDAAEKVNEIWNDVQGWWRQPEVQKAKDEFCHQFARTSKNWRKEWIEFLQGLRGNVKKEIDRGLVV